MNIQIMVSGCFGNEYVDKRAIELYEKNVEGDGPSHDRAGSGEALAYGRKHGGMAADDAVGYGTSYTYER